MIAKNKRKVIWLEACARLFLMLFLLIAIGMFIWVLLGLLFPNLPIFGR